MTTINPNKQVELDNLAKQILRLLDGREIDELRYLVERVGYGDVKSTVKDGGKFVYLSVTLEKRVE